MSAEAEPRREGSVPDRPALAGKLPSEVAVLPLLVSLWPGEVAQDGPPGYL